MSTISIVLDSVIIALTLTNAWLAMSMRTLRRSLVRDVVRAELVALAVHRATEQREAISADIAAAKERS